MGNPKSTDLRGLYVEHLGGTPNQSSPADPTAPASTSVYKMQGLAGAITPRETGNILILITGTIKSTAVTAGDGINLQASYGTGTAPANAATLAGTQVGQVVSYMNPTTVTAADVAVPFTVAAVVTGLVRGTAYWVDLAAESIATVSTVKLSKVSVSVVEL